MVSLSSSTFQYLVALEHSNSVYINDIYSYNISIVYTYKHLSTPLTVAYISIPFNVDEPKRIHTGDHMLGADVVDAAVHVASHSEEWQRDDATTDLRSRIRQCAQERLQLSKEDCTDSELFKSADETILEDRSDATFRTAMESVDMSSHDVLDDTEDVEEDIQTFTTAEGETEELEGPLDVDEHKEMSQKAPSIESECPLDVDHDEDSAEKTQSTTDNTTHSLSESISSAVQRIWRAVTPTRTAGIHQQATAVHPVRSCLYFMYNRVLLVSVFLTRNYMTFVFIYLSKYRFFLFY